MQLRAYDVPPFRADEFLLADGPVDVSGFIGAGPQIPLLIGGSPTVPGGFRAVVKFARQVVGSYANTAYAGPPTQWATRITWTLRRNGVAIPGYLNRPSSWTYGNVTGELYLGPSPSFYATLALEQITDLIVPIKLDSGDSLTYQFTNNSGVPGAMLGFCVQGYLFPVSNAQDSARGWLADEVEA